MPRDTREFTNLLEPHYNDALRYTRALCARWRPDDAEDVLQQSFLQALENFGSLKEDTKFKSWFFKIITRAFYTAVRKHFWRKFLPLDDNPGMLEIPDVYSHAEANEDGDILYAALAKLSAKERAAILLFEIADFSIEEIKAIQEEKSISAVKSRLSRSRTKLRKYLTGTDSKSFNKRLVKEDNHTNGNFIGGLEHETIRLISEIRTDK